MCLIQPGLWSQGQAILDGWSQSQKLLGGGAGA